MEKATVVPDWLPKGKTCGVCFTIDDVHPGKSTDAYEAGGDLGEGALGRVEWLLGRHQKLGVTLFTTPDWRELSPFPTRKLLQRIPYVRERVMLTSVLPRGTMRLDRHPTFVSYLQSLPRTEIGMHGLYHIHTGEKIFQEFQEENAAQCETILRKALTIFEDARLPFVRGMTPPGWTASPALLLAMSRLGFSYVASARDTRSPISRDARANMSGLKDVSLVRPEFVADGSLIHFTTNFQATNRIERAMDILRYGGLLAIKAHIVKHAYGYTMLDGLDDVYANYLDLLFKNIADEFGDQLWWTTMGGITDHVRAQRSDKSIQKEAATYGA